MSEIVKTTFHTLLELSMGPERDDYGIIRPTPDAFLTTLMLLFKASEHDKNYQIPPGNVSTDSEGGIRIEWLGEQRNVHLVVPVNKPAI